MFIRNGQTPHGIRVKQPNGYACGFDLLLAGGWMAKLENDEIIEWCSEHIGEIEKDFIFYSGYLWFVTEDAGMLFKLRFG